MKPVYLVSDVDSSLGAFGYSVVREPLVSGGATERLTLLFLRDREGYTQHAVILPSAAFGGAF
jgi:hypothetical protein